MGILVADEKKFNNGLVLSDFVMSVKGCIMEVLKIPSTTIYRIFYKVYYYLNQNAYNAGNDHIEIEIKHLDIQGDISGSIFNLIYEDIKSNYNNCTDI